MIDKGVLLALSEGFNEVARNIAPKTHNGIPFDAPDGIYPGASAQVLAQEQSDASHYRLLSGLANALRIAADKLP